MSDRVSISNDNGIVDVRLNRPDKLNALDQAMFQGIVDAGEGLKGDPDVRVVVLAGSVRSFCAGADLEHMRRMIESGEEENSRDALELASCLRALAALDKPVLARIHGKRRVHHGHRLGGGHGFRRTDVATAEEEPAVQIAFFDVVVVRHNHHGTAVFL